VRRPAPVTKRRERVKFTTYEQALAKRASSNDLLGYVVDTLTKFNDGEDVALDFLSRRDVGAFCAALGFAADRNWAELQLPQIAPTGPEGVQVVPEDEAVLVLSALKLLMQRDRLAPSADGSPAPNLLNDFLPAGTRFKKEKCLGHLWEFRYALAVELEHGVTRGTNVTNNHPLLTGLVVMAHLAEDTLYYARLWVMETEGELFNAELDRKPFAQIHDHLATLTLARKHLQARISEKIDAA
jgi:hypothetical protein